MPQHLDPRKIDKAVKLYQQGAKITDIERQTGVLRASLYHALKQRRLAPARAVRARDQRIANANDPDTSVQYLLERVTELQERLAAAEAALAAIAKLAGETTSRS